MISVTTKTLCLSFPDRFLPGRPLSAAEAEILESIRIKRLKWIVSGWLAKDMTKEEAQAHLDSFVKSYEFSSRPVTEFRDPVDLEAMTIARDLVRRKIAERDLNLEPQSIEAHAAELAKMPGVRARAQKIVQIRRDAVRNLIPSAR